MAFDITQRDQHFLDERWHELLKRDPREFEEWNASLELRLKELPFTPEIMEAQKAGD